MVVIPDPHERNELPLNEELAAALIKENLEPVETDAEEETTETSPPEPLPTPVSSSPIKIPFISRFRSTSSASSPKKTRVFYFTYILATLQNLHENFQISAAVHNHVTQAIHEDRRMEYFSHLFKHQSRK